MALPLIPILIVGGLLIDTFRGANECLKIDEQTKRKFALAYEKQAEAYELLKQKNNLLNHS